MERSEKQNERAAQQKRQLLEMVLKNKGIDVSRTKPINRRTALDSPRLSFAQQRLWFLDQLMPGGVGYNMPMALRLRRSLDVGALEKSLSEIISRHEALRTCFVSLE